MEDASTIGDPEPRLSQTERNTVESSVTSQNDWQMVKPSSCGDYLLCTIFFMNLETRLRKWWGMAPRSRRKRMFVQSVNAFVLLAVAAVFQMYFLLGVLDRPIFAPHTMLGGVLQMIPIVTCALGAWASLRWKVKWLYAVHIIWVLYAFFNMMEFVVVT